MDYSKIITIEPGKRSGNLDPRKTDDSNRRAGIPRERHDEEEILSDFPDLTAEDIKACLAFAAQFN